MFDAIDIALWKIFKKSAIKLIPAFSIELAGLSIGSWAFDITIVLVLAFTALAKANKALEKTKK